MAKKRRSVFDVLRSNRKTAQGRLVIMGSLIQLPMAVALMLRAWHVFPNQEADEFLSVGLLHLAIPLALIGSLAEYGPYFRYRNNNFLNVLLIASSLSPFALSLPLLGA